MDQEEVDAQVLTGAARWEEGAHDFFTTGTSNSSPAKCVVFTPPNVISPAGSTVGAGLRKMPNVLASRSPLSIMLKNTGTVFRLDSAGKPRPCRPRRRCQRSSLACSKTRRCVFPRRGCTQASSAHDALL